MDKLVDFSQPIEAVCTDGTVLQAKAFHRDGDKPSVFFVSVEGQFGWPFFNTGRPCHDFSGSKQWIIRNTAKPSTPSNEELTQRMEIEGETLVMLRRVLEIALLDPQVTHEAEKLLAILPKPVDPIDPDCLLISSIMAECGWVSEDNGYDASAELVRHAIEKVRTLAAGGTAHE